MNQKPMRLVVTELEERAVADANDSLQEAINLGSVVRVATASGSIASATDVTMYKVYLRAGKATFDTDTPTNGAPGLGSYIRLFDDRGTQLATNNDAQAPDEPPIPANRDENRFFDSYLEVQIPRDGWFYLGVSNWLNTGYNPVTGSGDRAGDKHLTGPYTLIVTATTSQDIKAVSASWAGLTPSGAASAAVIQVALESSGYSGLLKVRLYQSADATLNKSADVPLGEQSIAVTGNASQPRQVLLSSPPKPGVKANYVLVAVDPDGQVTDANRANNVVALRVTEPAALSFELESTAPLADTRKDRVELWLRQYRGDIVREAGLRAIDPRAIAGAIAWEAIHNVRSWSLRGVGPGKVHVTSSQVNAVLEFGRGSGVAVQVENRYVNDPNPARRLAQLSIAQRKVALADPRTAIKYVGAIMGAYAEEAATAGYAIGNRPEILTTYYNGAGVDLTNVAAVLKKKFPQPLQAGSAMGQWVLNNSTYLSRTVSG